MAKQNASEQFDRIVERLLRGPGAPIPRDETERPFDATVGLVIEVIGALRGLPRKAFKAQLRADLERRATMASSAKAAPIARAAATPYLSIKGAAAAIEFYKKAFGATESARLVQPDGRIGYAEINISGARIMVSDEFPEIDFRSPESLGGSPILIHLDVEDVDAFGTRAIAAGAKIVRPIADQFYGARSGQFADPFGYTWIISTTKEELSAEEMQRRMRENFPQQSGASAQESRVGAVSFIREGFHTVTPYLVISGAARWIEFAKQAFGAEERFRTGRPGAENVIMHAEVKIGDSMIELADANPQYPAMPVTLLLRVSDPDAVYNGALEAGATVFDRVTDHDYGSRAGTVVDPSGNRLHIFSPTPDNKIFADFRSVTPHLYADRPADLIVFMQQAFAGEEIYRVQTPEGGIPHAQVRIGDSIVALGGGRGPYQPMPSTLHLYVPDTDLLYERALHAGATSTQPPITQPYGDRSAGVTDPFGNRWFIATHLRDVAM